MGDTAVCDVEGDFFSIDAIVWRIFLTHPNVNWLDDFGESLLPSLVVQY